jgi:hypothetical protein
MINENAGVPDLITRLAIEREPFDPNAFEVWPAVILYEVEAERISLLQEFADVFASNRLLRIAQEHFDGDLWSSVLNFVIHRNIFRRTHLPGSIPEEPNDHVYAAQFYHAPDPEHASWDTIHAAAAKRDDYMSRLDQLLINNPINGT